MKAELLALGQAALVLSCGLLLAPRVGASGVGINLAPIRDYAPEHVFCDAARRAREWKGGRGEEIPEHWFDGRGWPLGLPAGARLKAPIFAAGSKPRGGLELWWRGDVQVQLVGDVSTVEDLTQPPAPWRRAVYRLRQVEELRGARVWIDVLAPREGAGLYDLRVWRAACGPLDGAKLQRFADGPVQFTPAFLERWRGARSLRFMEWLATNGSQRGDLSGDTRLDDPSWSHRGVPLEVAIDLANALDADPWINLPHRAEEELLREWASKVAARLEPHLRVYVEYSNELWNSQFAQARWAREQGQTSWPGLTPFEAQLRWAGARAASTTSRFAEYFQRSGGAKRRVVRVLATQAANAWTSEISLDAAGAGAFDALAIAPYLSLNVSSGSDPALRAVRSWSVGELLSYVDEQLVPQTEEWVRGHSELAAERDLPLLAYEMGQHLVGVGDGLEDPRVQELFRRANRHSRMEEIYLRHEASWRAAGGSLALYFRSMSAASRWGHWGLQERAGDDGAPKYRAWRQLAARRGEGVVVHIPRPTARCCAVVRQLTLIPGEVVDLVWRGAGEELLVHAIVAADGRARPVGRTASRSVIELVGPAEGAQPSASRRLTALRPGRSRIEWVATSMMGLQRGIVEVRVRPYAR